MPNFSFVARNAKGKTLRGVLRAESPDAAREQLSARRYDVVEVRELRGILQRIDHWITAVRAPSLVEIGFTTRQLAVMLEAGLPMTRALQVMNQQPLPNRLAEAWYQTSVSVNQGEYLSKAIGRYPDIFGMLYVGMVKAGEASGRMAENMGTIADHLEREAMLRAKIKAAMTYPVVILVVCALLSVMIVQYVLPQFLNGLFKDSGIQLPWMTRVLVEVTAFLNNPVSLGTTVAIVAVVSYGLLQYARTPVGQFRFQKLLLATPKVKALVAKILAARFCQTMGTLINSGIPILKSLELTNLVMGSYVLGDHIERMKGLVKEGGKLSEGLRDVPFFPPVVATFVQLGEETGQIPALMARLARIFEEDLDNALVAFTALIEPVMIGVMGGMVAFVLIAVFIPLYQILGNF